jgi:hypothetical protein
MSVGIFNVRHILSKSPDDNGQIMAIAGLGQVPDKKIVNFLTFVALGPPNEGITKLGQHRQDHPLVL